MTKTRELPDVERVGAWLGANLPASPPTTVVHGDYRLGNVMYAPDPPARLIAVFDWEMATLGDPLADVGYLTTMWFGPGDEPPGRFDLSPVTRAEGFPDTADLVARYAERSGRAVGDLRWYRTLAVWKASVFMETNYRRAMTRRLRRPVPQGLRRHGGRARRARPRALRRLGQVVGGRDAGRERGAVREVEQPDDGDRVVGLVDGQVRAQRRRRVRGLARARASRAARSRSAPSSRGPGGPPPRSAAWSSTE